MKAIEASFSTTKQRPRPFVWLGAISTAKPARRKPGGVTGGALPFGRGAVQFCFFLGGLASSMATMPRTLKAMTMMKAEV